MISSSCAKLPPGRTDAPCGAETSEFLGDVERAVRTLQSEQRSVFDGEQVLSVGSEFPYWEDPSLWSVLELVRD